MTTKLMASVFIAIAFSMQKASAGPFTVDDSTFVVTGGSVGIGTKSPGKTLEVNGTALVDSSMTFGVNMHNFAQADLTGQTNSDTSFHNCIAGSTIAINFSGSPSYLVIETDGAVFNGTPAGNTPILNFLQDGAYVSPFSQTNGFVEAGGSNKNCNLSARVHIRPSAGTHSYCLLHQSSGNTTTFGGSGTTVTRFFFKVYEEK